VTFDAELELDLLPAMADDLARRARSLTDDCGAAVDAWAAAGRSYFVEGRPADGASAFQDAIALAGADRQRDLLVELGELLSDAGEPAAMQVWSELHELSLAAGNADDAARACFFLFHTSGDAAWLERGAAVPGEHGWSQRCGAVLATMVDDNPARGRELCAAASVAARATGDEMLEVQSLWGYATADSYLGQHDRAVLTMRHVVRRLTERGGRRWLARACSDLSEILYETADAAAMVEHARWLETFVRANRINTLRGYASGRVALGLARAGMMHEAATSIESSVPLDERLAGTVDAVFTAALEAVVMSETHPGAEASVERMDAARAMVEAAKMTTIGVELDVCELRLALASGAQTPAAALAGFVPDTGEAIPRSLCAVSMARAGAARGERELVMCALDVTSELEAGIHGRLVDMLVAEVRAIAARDAVELSELASAWQECGFPRDALWCRHMAAVARGGADIAGSLGRLHSQLVGLGARLDAAIAITAMGSTSDAHKVEAVAASPILGGMSESELAELVAESVVTRVGAGESVLHVGDACAHLYLVARGTVVLQREGSDKVLSVGYVDAGDVFGQFDLSGAAAVAVSVVAIADCELIAIPVGALRRVTRTNPRIAELLASGVAHQLAEHQRRMEQLAYWSVDERLEELLQQLAARYGRATLSGGVLIDRQLDQSDLARFVGTSRQTLATSIAKLRKAGRVATRRGQLVLYTGDEE
jgi:CRP/FNR family transcriptional regulator